MKWETQACPECGGEPVAYLETIPGLVQIAPDEKGGFDHIGETEMLWDDSRPDLEGVARV